MQKPSSKTMLTSSTNNSNTTTKLSNAEYTFEEKQFYNELISICICDCGILPIYETNIDTKYSNPIINTNIHKQYINTHSKCKSLINGYIKENEKELLNGSVFVYSIIPIITAFYTSFKSKQVYDNQINHETKSELNPTAYTSIVNNNKSLINGYIRDEEKELIKELTFPDAILPIIETFYDDTSHTTHDDTKSNHETKNQLNIAAIVEYIPKWVKGCYSKHSPTQSLSIFNIHKLFSMLYLSEDYIYAADIFGQVINTGIITHIFDLVMERGVDMDDLSIKCIQILKYMTYYREDNTVTKSMVEKMNCFIPLLNSASFMIKKELFEAFSNLGCIHNHMFMSKIIKILMPQCANIWSVNYDEYNECEPSELSSNNNNNIDIWNNISGSEYANYNNSEKRYFEYLEHSCALLYNMLAFIAINSEDTEHTNYDEFIKLCKLTTEQNENIIKWISFVLDILKWEFESSHLYQKEIENSYTNIGDTLFWLIDTNDTINNNMND
eukprot:502706_1